MAFSDRDLRAAGGDTEGADHGVACEVEAVDEADEPPLLVEWPGPELSEALTGESDETS